MARPVVAANPLPWNEEKAMRQYFEWAKRRQREAGGIRITTVSVAPHEAARYMYRSIVNKMTRTARLRAKGSQS